MVSPSDTFFTTILCLLFPQFSPFYTNLEGYDCLLCSESLESLERSAFLPVLSHQSCVDCRSCSLCPDEQVNNRN